MRPHRLAPSMNRDSPLTFNFFPADASADAKPNADASADDLEHSSVRAQVFERRGNADAQTVRTQDFPLSHGADSPLSADSLADDDVIWD